MKTGYDDDENEFLMKNSTNNLNIINNTSLAEITIYRVLQKCL